MLLHKTEIRVRYADTDQMHFVYNGKYFEYFEVGRTEMLRENGLPYDTIEKQNYQLPVIETGAKYISPAFYDDLLIIESIVKSNPIFRIHIDYRVLRLNSNELLVVGFTEHVFINVITKKVVRPPKFFRDSMKPFF